MCKVRRIAAPAVVIGSCLTVGITHRLLLAAVLGAAVLSVVLVALTSSGFRHARFARFLHRRSASGFFGGIDVRFTHLRGSAAVAGLSRPAIYCDPELLQRLSGDEQRAVALHEDWHRRQRDPLRLVVLAGLEPVLSRLPGGRPMLELARARLEVAADRYALRQGVSRPALAGALLKVERFEPNLAPAFATATELRLLALLDDDDRPLRRTWRRSCVKVGCIAAAAAACAPIFGGTELLHLIIG